MKTEEKCEHAECQVVRDELTRMVAVADKRAALANRKPRHTAVIVDLNGQDDFTVAMKLADCSFVISVWPIEQRTTAAAIGVEWDESRNDLYDLGRAVLRAIGVDDTIKADERDQWVRLIDLPYENH